jgi:type 1 fimbriae regulatory protein FimB
MNAPLNVVQMPVAKPVQHRGEREFLTPEELKRFMKAAKSKGPREHAMFLFAVAHGARAQEVCNLKYSDLQLEQGRVFVDRVKNSEESLQHFLQVPGNTLFNERKAFEKWLAVRKVNNPEDHVFNSRQSTKLNRVTVFNLFREICETAGIPKSKAHPHAAKHTLAQLLMDNGANAFTIQKALGHKSISSTLQYSKPSGSQASEAIAAAFKKAV